MTGAIKVVAFGGSNSRKSINKQLAVYVAGLIPDANVEVLDMNDFAMPLFGVDLEKTAGPQEKAKDFLAKMRGADLLVVSLAENNGSYSVAFKNVLDWCSRSDNKVFAGKPMFLMATSPGARGGKSVLDAAVQRFPIHAAQVKATFSLPEFEKNFVPGQGIVPGPLLDEMQMKLREVLKGL